MEMSEKFAGFYQAVAAFFLFDLALVMTMEGFAGQTTDQFESIRFATFNAALIALMKVI